MSNPQQVYVALAGDGNCIVGVARDLQRAKELCVQSQTEMIGMLHEEDLELAGVSSLDSETGPTSLEWEQETDQEVLRENNILAQWKTPEEAREDFIYYEINLCEVQ